MAARAGVSLKTVTNVVHARPNVSPGTRERVLAAIADLDYRPSLIGRQLQSGRSHTVTLAVPRIDEPYLGALAHALIAAADAQGYTVVMDETGGREDRERWAVQGYPGHGVDGVIFSPLVLNPPAMAAGSRQTPIVLLGEPVANSFADYVAIDNERSAHDVVDHLVSQGRRRFAFLGATPERLSSVGASRHRAVAARLAATSLAEPLAVPQPRYSREGGALAIEMLRPNLDQVDALVCASDLLAIGAMRALHEVGVHVPDDIAVTGWDDIVDCEYTSPTLTSVSPDLQELAETATSALLRRIEGYSGPAVTHQVKHALRVRQSSTSLDVSR